MTDSTPHTLESLLGIDPNDPVLLLAENLTEASHKFKEDLIALRRATCTREDVAQKLAISPEKVASFETYFSNPTLTEITQYALAIQADVSFIVKRSPLFSEISDIH